MALTVSEDVVVPKLLLLVASVAFTWNESVVVLVGVPVCNPELLTKSRSPEWSRSTCSCHCHHSQPVAVSTPRSRSPRATWLS